jgi:peptidyl-prolyl cis-trans isomerase C
MSKETRYFLIAICIIAVAIVSGCEKKENKDKAKLPSNETQQSSQGTASPGTLGPFSITQEPVIAPEKKDLNPKQSQGIAISVDGNVLTKEELERKTKEAMQLLKGKYPEEKRSEVYEGIKKKIMDDFVVRTLLVTEVNQKKIAVTEKEIQNELARIKANLPPGKEVNDFLKENRISREDLALGIKIRKLVEKEAGKSIKPTEKEINQFYAENKDKFIQEESVHVRHILTTIDPKDDEKTKAEKKAKMETLRKQIIEGADFAEIAKKHSDCPSKEGGGDLGDIKKGQTVKPFEDAAFSQEVNAIGPVITTEYGYHIIQVLGKNPSKVTKLDEVRDKIAMHLEQNKHRDAFGKLMDRLQKNAVILRYEK